MNKNVYLERSRDVDVNLVNRGPCTERRVKRKTGEGEVNRRREKHTDKEPRDRGPVLRERDVSGKDPRK